MGRSQHKESRRVCPGCDKEKTYPVRNECCSNDCRRLLEAKRRLESKSDPAKIMRLEKQNTDLRKEINRLLAQQILDEDYQKFIGRIERRKVISADFTLPKRGTKHHEVVPVVNWSDWHFDEVVRAEEVQGRNAYNREIALMRLKMFTANTIKVGLDYLKGFNYSGLVLNSLGDIFTGSIHEELARTNEDQTMSSVLYYVSPVIRMLKEFAKAFGKVSVNSVVGNHGRNTKKPIWKGRVRDNFDWLFMQMVARELGDDSRITFNIAEGTKLLFKIYDWTFICTHGDECKGGSGIAGMLSPQLIAMARMKKVFEFDYWLLGHWHNLGSYRGIRANGCGKGWDEYAMGSNFDYQDPQQDFFLVNKKHGYIGGLPIFVLHPDEAWRANFQWRAA